MTTKQRAKFYFPAWARAAHVHGWDDLPTAVQLDCWATPDLNPLYQAIWFHALDRANQADRRVRLEDFRHAFHIVALGGRDKSANDLTNDEMDRVVALFNLLADPYDLRAVMAWQSPNDSRRRRLLHWIKTECVESYVIAVAREKFGTDNITMLPFEQLKQLHMTLRNRPASRKQP